MERPNGTTMFGIVRIELSSLLYRCIEEDLVETVDL